MKIVYCLPQLYNPGGIERIVTIKANYLANVFGWDVTIVLAAQNGRPIYYELSNRIRIVDLQLPYFDMLSMPLLNRIRFKQKIKNIHMKKLTDVLFDIRPDVTVSTFTFEANFLPQIKDGSKKVLEFHFCRGHKRLMADSFNYSGVKKLLYYWACWEEENLVIPKYDKFVVLTKEDQQRWLPKKSNVAYIPNILPFNIDGTVNYASKVVIAVGRLDAQKGFDRLIGIWSLLANDHKDWKLKIYGEGSDKQRLQKQIDSLGLSSSVTLCGSAKDIRSKYLESSIFVMTSRYEGMPMTMLEAKSLGLPVVSYDFPCGPKDLINDGIDGFVVKDGEKNNFAIKLAKLMNEENLRIEFGANSRSNAAYYAEKNIMELWRQLFVDITK